MTTGYVGRNSDIVQNEKTGVIATDWLRSQSRRGKRSITKTIVLSITLGVFLSSIILSTNSVHKRVLFQKLITAIHADDLLQVTNLIQSGAEVNLPTESGNYLRISNTLAKLGLHLPQYDQSQSPLVTASAWTCAEIPSLNKNINFRSKACQDARINNGLIVNSLIKAGANVNDRDARRITPLMASADNLNLEAFQELIMNGADIYMKSPTGSTVDKWLSTPGWEMPNRQGVTRGQFTAAYIRLTEKVNR